MVKHSFVVAVEQSITWENKSTFWFTEEDMRLREGNWTAQGHMVTEAELRLWTQWVLLKAELVFSQDMSVDFKKSKQKMHNVRVVC